MKRILIIALSVVMGGILGGCTQEGLVAKAQVKQEILKCEGDIPQQICDFVAEHQGGLFPDMKGAMFAEFSIARPGFGGESPMTIGWLLPKEGEDQFAVLPNGIVKKVAKPGAEQVLDETVVKEKIFPVMNEMIYDGFRSYQDGSNRDRVLAVLVAVGRQDLAQVAAKSKSVDQQMLGVQRSSDLIGTSFRYRNAEVSDAYGARDWNWALRVAKILDQNADKRPKQEVNLDPTMVVTPKDVIRDLERRLSDSRSLVDYRTIPTQHGKERWEQLLRALDGSTVVEQNGNYGDPSYLLVAEGQDIIPFLLEDLKTEDRLSASSSNLFMTTGRLPGPVRRMVVQVVQQIWEGMPSDRLTDLNDPKKAEAAADWYLEKWMTYKGLRLSQRIYKNIESGTMNEYQLSQSIKELFGKAGPGSPAPYVPGKTPMNIDEFSAEQKEFVADKLEQTLMQSTANPRENRHYSDNLVIGLAKLRGKDSLPALQRYTRDLLTMIQANRQNSPLNQYGKPFGAVIAQRIAIGDRDAAMMDLAAVMPLIKQFDSTEFKAMRAAWEFPKDKELQSKIEKVLMDWAKNKDDEGQTINVNFVWPPRSNDIFQSPGVRSFVIKQLRDSRAYGEATVTRVDVSSVSYSYKTPNSGGSSGSSVVPKDIKVGQVIAFTKGDFVADQMRRHLNNFKFSLVGSVAERKAAREEMVKIFESGKLPAEENYGLEELSIWRP